MCAPRVIGRRPPVGKTKVGNFLPHRYSKKRLARNPVVTPRTVLSAVLYLFPQCSRVLGFFLFFSTLYLAEPDDVIAVAGQLAIDAYVVVVAYQLVKCDARRKVARRVFSSPERFKENYIYIYTHKKSIDFLRGGLVDNSRLLWCVWPQPRTGRSSRAAVSGITRWAALTVKVPD